MAHNSEKRKQARNLYIHSRQGLEAIALAIDVSTSTIRRWKTADAKAGDDWDLPRAAQLMSGRAHDEIVAEAIEGFTTMYQASLDAINKDYFLSAQDRVKLVASLSDSFAKMMSASGKAAPSLSKLAIAHEVITALAKFIEAHNQSQGKNNPAALGFLALIEPFAEHLAKDPKWQ